MLKSVYPKHKDRKYTFFIKKGVQIDKTPIFSKRFTDREKNQIKKLWENVELKIEY